MSTALELDCKVVMIDEPNKVVFMSGLDGHRHTFTYNILCTADLDFFKIKFFFSFESFKSIIIYKESGVYKCYVVGFEVRNDTPLFAVSIFAVMERVLSSIEVEFRDKYASYLIDETINS